MLIAAKLSTRIRTKKQQSEGTGGLQEKEQIEVISRTKAKL